MTTPRPRITLAALALVATLGLAGCSTTDLPASDTTSSSVAATASTAPASSSSPSASAAGGAASSTLALLATLPVKGKAPMTGYDRVKDFGPAWMDTDHNGCDTRNDLIAQQLTDIVKSGSCKVLSGTLHDPYTGKVIHFVRGPQSAVIQADHVVPLANAWVTGAQQLTLAQREQLANDEVENLLMVDGPANEQKSDGDAATWLPPVKSFRCTYVTKQVRVKAKYHLWVTPAEHDAIANILNELR